ncbi:MAG: endonuclease III [Actinobacteria bacterium]|nr:endonuclease III [Actinomycetota bacterium]
MATWTWAATWGRPYFVNRAIKELLLGNIVEQIESGTVEKAREIGELLEQEYGRPAPRKRLSPLDELILTILSQHTSDMNSDRAFAALKERFPSWEAVRDARVDEIADAIKSGGLARMKAPRIKDLLLHLHVERGSLDLDFLHGMGLEEGRSYLLNLGGVGPKTAACVLLFSCGKPAFPVDTHVHRVARRLGLIDATTTADEAHRLLEAMVPPDEVYTFHVNLITHGRRICKSQRPLCEQCVLAPKCDFFATNRIENESKAEARSR